MGPPTLFTIPVLRYMKTYGLTHEQLAMVSVVQREWAAKNPRPTFKTPITVEDVLNSRMIAYPFRLLQCCLVTDGGGALILVSADRAKDFPQKPVYLLGTGESVETPMVSQMEDFTSSRAFRIAGPTAFAEGQLPVNRGLTNHAVAIIAWYFRGGRSPRSGGRFALMEMAGPDLNLINRQNRGWAAVVLARSQTAWVWAVCSLAAARSSCRTSHRKPGMCTRHCMVSHRYLKPRDRSFDRASGDPLP
jgi:hypothetical protein